MRIKPKMVDGDPVCSGENCLAYSQIGCWCKVSVCHCMKSPRSEINPGNICIPGIRKQRDELKRELKKARGERDEARREVCNLLVDARQHEFPGNAARLRDWKGLF